MVPAIVHKCGSNFSGPWPPLPKNWEKVLESTHCEMDQTMCAKALGDGGHRGKGLSRINSICLRRGGGPVSRNERAGAQPPWGACWHGGHCSYANVRSGEKAVSTTGGKGKCGLVLSGMGHSQVCSQYLGPVVGGYLPRFKKVIYRGLSVHGMGRGRRQVCTGLGAWAQV